MAEISHFDVQEWTGVILDPSGETIGDLILNPKWYEKILVENIAANLYENIQYSGIKNHDSFEFEALENEEKEFWLSFAAEIPYKLKSLNLFIRRGREFIRTCIITDDEIEHLVNHDHNRFFKERSLLRELDFMIPQQLGKAGFEIIRKEEDTGIDQTFIRRLARAVHSRYLMDMKKMMTENHIHSEIRNEYSSDFDNLPEDIRLSNMDSACHIPTKLLSIGYKIRPLQEGYGSFALHLNDDEIETMARIEHLRWSWDKRMNGWRYGNVKDILKKTHPGLIPYEKLSEAEKQKDRDLVKLIPALLQDIEYTAYPIVPESISNLAYSIKPQSSINKLLNETRSLNDEIRAMAPLSPAIEERLRIINKNIEETIIDVKGNYNYARHIQKTFLPGDLYVRECFPESFILYQPKDIVSGDFYFFSRMESCIVFAAGDCTGHGIPGALLSTIGYGMTDQAVNEIKLKDPSGILHHLFTRLRRFLRRDEEGNNLFDDLDIAVCSLDLNGMVLTYSGVSIPVWIINNGGIREFKARNSIGNCNAFGECFFESDCIPVKTGDTLYLFSDGYADQFGGTAHKKYQRSRLRQFLLSIQEYPMPEQRDRLYEEFELWREENDEDQTDDVLVIGIKI